MVEFRLLGPVEIHVDGRPVELGRPQLRAVLAALAVEPGRPVSAGTLVERVWDGTPPPRVRATLYSHITRIRRTLESAGGVALVRRPAGYVLDADPEDVDLHRFRRLIAAAAESGRPDVERADLLRAALGLWQGTPLAGVPGGWASRTRVGWRQHRLDAAVAWAEVELRLDRGVQVIPAVRELLAEYPLAEPLVATLMRALAAAGRIPEALECYAAARKRLVDELGTEPGTDIRALHQAILRGDSGTARPTGQGDAPATGGPVRPAASKEPRPAQLPRETRGFTGRHDALKALDALLDPPTAAPSTAGPSTVVVSAVSGTAGIGKPIPGIWHIFPACQVDVDRGSRERSGSHRHVRTATRPA